MTKPDPDRERYRAQLLQCSRNERRRELVQRRDLNEVLLARRIFALRMQAAPSTFTEEQLLAFAKQQAHIAIEAATEFEEHAFSLLEDQYQ